MRQFLTLDEASHQIQCRSHESISRRVNGQIVKSAEYFSPGEQMASLGREDIDTTTDASKHHLATAIAASEIPPKPALSSLRK